MTDFVFIGPTLRADEVSSVLPGAVCLPPVTQGDVYRVVRQQPRAVGIVDGFFSGAPSVWHKEILWALSQGVAVFGSASMGALRAAELHTFGMQGVGRIFEAYRDGVLEDDDEVAVVHGPSETGFIAASEPMVNVRATLNRAESSNVISAATRSRIESVAKSLFFVRRTWPGVLQAAADDGVAGAEISAVEKWLPEGAIDQKREDALAMLAAMREPVEAARITRAAFHFEQTHFWDEMVERSADGSSPVEPLGLIPEGLLDEVRLLGTDAYGDVVRRALARLLAERESHRRGFSPPADARADVAAEHRKDLSLFLRDQLAAWMSQNDLDQQSYDRLIEQEAVLRQFTEASSAVLMPYLLDELRMSGQFHRLVTRARDKAEHVGKYSELPSAVFPNTAQLRVWYFEDRLGVPIPEDTDTVAAALGFESAEDFYGALRREWMYTRKTGGDLFSSDEEADGSPSD